MRKKSWLLASAWAWAAAAQAQVLPLDLPGVTVLSPRVANQSPVGSFAMPVSALRFEPLVDIQARNLAEGQSDITIRGGIFENAGFRIGSSTVADPQTGHYLADIPIAPAMLTVPVVATGADNALASTNANVGTIGYDWRKIRTGGSVALGAGEFSLNRQEFYQGYAADRKPGGHALGMDVNIARSESDGPVKWGDHDFSRINSRLQLSSDASQTDLFAGYQAKRFGWPNLYTPYNSNETENLQTVLVMLNHRVSLRDDDFFQAGAYYRRNKDDYAYDRFAPVGAVHPFQHTTWMHGLALEGRQSYDAFGIFYRGEVLADKLVSTSLTAGKYRSRTITKISAMPEKAWSSASDIFWRARAGLTFDDTNRNQPAVSPVVEFSREHTRADGTPLRLHLSYAQTSQVPTYTALNSSPASGLFRGNPNLGRATSRNTELGLATAIAGWKTSGAIFFRRDVDLVDWTYSRLVTARAANAVDIGTLGFEVVTRRAWQAWEVVAGYTWLDKDADYKQPGVDASFYALNYANHRFTAAVTWRIGRGFELRWDNQARIQEKNRLRQRGGDEVILSAVSLAYRPPQWKRIEVSVAVDNLWDSQFQEVPAVPAAGRVISGNLIYAW